MNERRGSRDVLHPSFARSSLPLAYRLVPLAGYFRSFLAHSQHAQPPETAQAAVAPPGSPFLSPYFISDAAAKVLLPRKG